MRRRLWPVYLCGIALCALGILTATAQQSSGMQQMSVGQNQSTIAAMLAPVTGEPYRAQKVTRSVQTLSDRTVITHESRGVIARDAEGRMREDLYQTSSGSVNGRESDTALQSSTVNDPVAHTMLFWTGLTKTAFLTQMPAPPTLQKNAIGTILAAPPPPGVGHRPSSDIQMIKEDAPPLGAENRNNNMPNFGVPKLAMPAPLRSKDEVHTEDLGQQSMEGVLVTGKRVTTTIPAGEVGNDRPIVVVHEEWRSPDLKIVVKTIDTDPRTGEQTMELTGLLRGDPDAALFQAPAGYQVKDMDEVRKSLGNNGNTDAAK